MGGRNNEPTNHALRELEAVSEALEAWGRPVLVAGPSRPAGLANMVGLPEAGDDLMDALDKTGTPGRSLPIIALCDSFGRIFYISKGYNTSLASDLATVL